MTNLGKEARIACWELKSHPFAASNFHMCHLLLPTFTCGDEIWGGDLQKLSMEVFRIKKYILPQPTTSFDDLKEPYLDED